MSRHYAGVVRAFRATSYSITLATNRFSLVFSSSSCFRRLASDRANPPYLAFSLLNVAGLSQCFRCSYAIGKPASRSLILLINWTSVKRLFLIRLSLQGWGDSTLKRGYFLGCKSDKKPSLAEASRASTLPSCQSSQSSASVRGPVGMCSSLFLAGMHVRTGRRGGDPLPRAGLSLIRKAMLWSWPA